MDKEIYISPYRKLPEKAAAALLLACARPAYAAQYSNAALAEHMAIYQAGYWFGMMADKRQPQAIAAALGLSLAVYQSAVEAGKIEAVAGDIGKFSRAREAFVQALAKESGADQPPFRNLQPLPSWS